MGFADSPRRIDGERQGSTDFHTWSMGERPLVTSANLPEPRSHHVANGVGRHAAAGRRGCPDRRVTRRARRGRLGLALLQGALTRFRGGTHRRVGVVGLGIGRNVTGAKLDGHRGGRLGDGLCGGQRYGLCGGQRWSGRSLLSTARERCQQQQDRRTMEACHAAQVSIACGEPGVTALGRITSAVTHRAPEGRMRSVMTAAWTQQPTRTRQ